MTPQRLEEITLNAWPALQYMFFDGWVLRFANGYTKRANSINPLFASSLDTLEKIATCERIYREKGLRPVFKLTSFSCPADIDERLAQQNYKVIDETCVLYLDLSQHDHDTVTDLPEPLDIKALDEWLEIFCDLKDASIDAHQTHLAMLKLIPSPCLPATWRNEAGVHVASAMGVLENEYFGLFDMVTKPAYRQQGHASNLVSGMLQWAKQQGARHAYLQVVSANTAARGLYHKIGYRELYRYWYRVPNE